MGGCDFDFQRLTYSFEKKNKTYIISPFIFWSDIKRFVVLRVSPPIQVTVVTMSIRSQATTKNLPLRPRNGMLRSQPRNIRRLLAPLDLEHRAEADKLAQRLQRLLDVPRP